MHDRSIARFPWGELALLLWLLVLLTVIVLRVGRSVPSPPTAPAGTAVVVRVIDGDTIRVRLADGSEAAVRLLGVDSPEVHRPDTPVQCWGREASAWLDARATGKAVTLLADPTGDDIDRYGRLLRYAVLEGEQDMVNYTLVLEGQAFAYTRFRFREQARFVAAERTARSAKRGLWSQACAYDQAERGDKELLELLRSQYTEGTGR